MATIELDYIATGGNRHSSASDWTPRLLAFGAGNNIALWDPQDESNHGIFELLSGHTATVTAIKISQTEAGQPIIISGSADKTLRLWTPTAKNSNFREIQCLTSHTAAINTITSSPTLNLFVSGSADGQILIWNLESSTAKLLQSLPLKPRYLPLAAAIHPLDSSGSGATILAVAGTTNSIQLFCRTAPEHEFQLQATLTGHEGWVRSLDFTSLHTPDGKGGGEGEVLLASGSQDKYIRLWKFRRSTSAGGSDGEEGKKKSLSNRTRLVGAPSREYAVTYEALLVGHEDWVYSVRWAHSPGKEGNEARLLSASADNSLSIWRADSEAGVWVCGTRLGEISSQKGSTTATGSIGGFWAGLWRPDDGGEVVSLGRTGSWRRWVFDEGLDMWRPSLGISGHTKEVQSLAWSPSGGYLISTASDQTTRLFAEWLREGKVSWHEFSRPQIHGYDLNCIDSVTGNQFISGADEKLLRVFNKPKAVDALLSKLSGSETSPGEMPDAANIPVLGLSNKAVTAIDDDDTALINEDVNGGTDNRDSIDPASVVRKSTLDITHPPLEDHLARHTLWPEHEKLYGHGYEISTATCSNDRSLVATACKASSLDHAVIRLYDTHDWREVKPPLASHTLTVTALAFSPDDRFLLSVGRDRQWVVFERSARDPKAYEVFASNPKGHSRMILDCCWLPGSVGYVFATAGRDKAVKFWRLAGDGVSFESVEGNNVSASATAVTAIASESRVDESGRLRVVYGTEGGRVVLLTLEGEMCSVVEQVELEGRISPSMAISCLRWRPSHDGEEKARAVDRQLAVGSEDHSVRIYKIP